MSKMEKRFLKVNNVEIRTASNGEGEDKTEDRFVSGTGAVYGEEVEIWPGYMEKVRSGAFDESLTSGDEIKSYFNHNPDFVLSTTKSTPALELNSTSAGLVFDSPIPPTTYGEDLAVNLERGNVRGASFSFTVDEDILIIDENDIYHREIVKATLFEVGPVTNPAYPQTEVGVRDREASFNEIQARVKADQKLKLEKNCSNLNLYKAKLEILEVI
ncbi:MAG: HK97 family phage prohead protease [Candidatus Hodarchaeales archaeon]